MKSDYLYPAIADRHSPAEWEEDGALDMRTRAIEVARNTLAAHYPRHIPDKVDRWIRARHDILLPTEAMRAG